MTKRKSFVLQTARTDCGVASALTVLNLMSRKTDPVHAVDHMDPDRAGTSLDALRRYMEEHYGLAARSLGVPADKVGRIKGRVILHMRQMHYVVLLNVSRAGVLCFDPAMGPVFYPQADFAKLYSGHLLEVKNGPRGATLPAVQTAAPVVGGGARLGMEPVSLFVLGAASRILECAIMLCLVAVLFLVLNHASFPSMLMAFALIAVCSGLLLLARQTRFEGEDIWIRRKQTRLWRSLLRTSLRGRDLNGFRGRYEKDVSGSVRRGMIMTIPQRSQIPAAIGTVFALSALLCLLSPILAVVHLLIFGFVLITSQLENVQVCRISVRDDIGRYSKLSEGSDFLNSMVAPDMVGEVAKWIVIGFAGFSVLLGALPPVALMFWILVGMQIVPVDFRRAPMLAPALGMGAPVSGLTGTEVPLRRQRVLGDADLKVSRSSGLTRIDGLMPLTATLRQPDLTVREQRLIMADVVRLAFKNLPQNEVMDHVGPIRIFGPGQDATQADFEHLMIAKESRNDQNLPVVSDGRKTMDQGLQDPVLRDLHSCEPGDFPVFWDFRERMPVTEIQAKLKDIGLSRAGHLTMKRLTVVEAA